jgi:hypothetical protein
MGEDDQSGQKVRGPLLLVLLLMVLLLMVLLLMLLLMVLLLMPLLVPGVALWPVTLVLVQLRFFEYLRVLPRYHFAAQ